MAGIQSFISTPRRKLLLALLCSSLFSLALLEARVYFSGSWHYLFLQWNLFLAVLPLLFSSLLLVVEKRMSARLLIGGLMILWLAFFPNAPYILTDLFHLRPRQQVPLWFDLLLLLSFAWNGLLMGFLSLRDMQLLVEKWFGRLKGWLFALGAMTLASFGIYLGRYLRWNSWDVLAEPQLLLMDIADRLINPLAHPRTYGFTIAFSIFLIFSYIMLNQFSRLNSR